MDRVLVTGSSGQVGSSIVDDLRAAGRPVEGLDLRPSRWTSLVADVRAPPSLAGFDAVVHCAARVSVPLSIETPCDDASHNVMGTIALLDAARRAGVRRFVFFSSAAVYDGSHRGACAESAPLAPASPYGLGKSVGEAYVRLFGDVYGIETVCLRPFNIFSERQDPSSPYAGVISRFLADARAGRAPTVFGDGSATRDFVHVRDVVQAVHIALEHPRAAGGTFNVGTGRATSIRQLATMVAQRLGSPPPRHGPPRANELRHSVADITRLRGLGFVSTTALASDLDDLAGAQARAA